MFVIQGPTPYLRLVSWMCSMGGLLFGFASSSINDFIPFMRRELGLSPAGVGIVTASFMVGAAFGSLIGGRLADRYGRKRTLVCCDALFIVGTVCTSVAPTFEVWFWGNFGGFSVKRTF
jgi:major inositol transporter-like SP family MFS transporter